MALALPPQQLGYCYFMLTRREFSWEGTLDRHVGRWERRALAAAGFDTQRYAHLKAEARRLSDLLAAQRAAEAAQQQAADAALADDGGNKQA